MFGWCFAHVLAVSCLGGVSVVFRCCFGHVLGVCCGPRSPGARMVQPVLFHWGFVNCSVSLICAVVRKIS